MKGQVEFVDCDYKYGYNISKQTTMVKTITDIIKNTPLSAVQFFVTNNRSKYPPKFDYNDLMAARRLIHINQLYACIHGSYVCNLAGCAEGEADSNFSQSLSSTIKCLTGELDYGAALNIGVVVHPGSQKDSKVGLKRISTTIEDVLTRITDEAHELAKRLNITPEQFVKRRKIILENAAGEGTKLCSTLEEIQAVIQGVRKDLRCQIKVCIDTAHAFGRGLYHWGKVGDIEFFYNDFDKIVGLQHLEVFHFNDSRVPFGEKKDKHEQLGCGYIFGSTDRALQVAQFLKNKPTLDKIGDFYINLYEDVVTDLDYGFSSIHQISTFMLQAKKHGIAVIGEPPISGQLDWSLVAHLLSNTDYPLSTTV